MTRNKLATHTVGEQTDGKLLAQSDSMSPRNIVPPDVGLLVVNGAWYLDALPSHIVVELTDGSLAKFTLTPFRNVQGEMTAYKSYHPRQSKGQPLPEYLYRHYGLSRNEESLAEVIRVRVSPSEKERLEAYAANLEPRKTVSEVLRDFIRGLR